MRAGKKGGVSIRKLDPLHVIAESEQAGGACLHSIWRGAECLPKAVACGLADRSGSCRGHKPPPQTTEYIEPKQTTSSYNGRHPTLCGLFHSPVAPWTGPSRFSILCTFLTLLEPPLPHFLSSCLVHTLGEHRQNPSRARRPGEPAQAVRDHTSVPPSGIEHSSSG